MKTKLYNEAYVVAWEYDTGGGFDWYFNEDDALKAFENEKKLCRICAKDGWHAISFVFKRRRSMDAKLMTQAIGDFINGHDADFEGIEGTHWPVKRVRTEARLRKQRKQ